MEGERRKSDSEETPDNPLKAEKVTEESPGGTEAASAVGVPGPAATSMVILEAIVRGIQAPQGKWPGEALKAVLGRFKRVPRGGWLKCHSIFCETFSCGIDPDEFRRQANFVIVSSSGYTCSRRKFAEESTKRVKTVDTYIEENTLHEAKVYLKVKQKYN